jgi:hypothetical protein
MPDVALSCNAGMAGDIRQERPAIPSAKEADAEELAFEAEIDLAYVGGIERGKRNPSLMVMAGANCKSVISAVTKAFKRVAIQSRFADEVAGMVQALRGIKSAHHRSKKRSRSWSLKSKEI